MIIVNRVSTKTHQVDSSTGAVTAQKSTSAAAHVSEQSPGSNINPSSAQNVFNRAMGCAQLRVISKTTAVTIGGGLANDTALIGLTITAALTGTCVITGFADSDGNATSITLPAATPAGFKDFRGSINSAGALTITCSTAGDDNLVSVHYWPVS